MEFINEFIHLGTKTSSHIESSFCETSQDESYIYLTFGLFANDCLFDLASKNYEFKIRISQSYLEKYNEPFAIQVEKQSICCNTQAKLLEIAQCKLIGLHRKIFLESSILFLLYQSQKNSLIFQSGCDSCENSATTSLHGTVHISLIHSNRKKTTRNKSESTTFNNRTSDR